MSDRLRKWVREWGGLVLFIVLMVLFRSSVADWYTVPTGSMKPNILEGDRIFVNKLQYDIRVPFTHWSLKSLGDPKRGDIIVLDSPVEDKRLVKRVIGVPGDVIALRDNRLYINGKAARYSVPPKQPDPSLWHDDTPNKEVLREKIFHHSYPIAVNTIQPGLMTFGPVVVPKNKYFVMGDNRDNSADSRYIGFIPREDILGRASYVVMSLNYDNHYLPRSDRFMEKLP
jgi:signal peptidase I